MPVEFPFQELSLVDQSFGGIPNRDEVVAAIPKEFYEDTQFSMLARAMMHDFVPDRDLQGLVLLDSSKDDAIVKRDYLFTWLKSFYLAHEVKMAGAAWMLSKMFTKIPDQE